MDVLEIGRPSGHCYHICMIEFAKLMYNFPFPLLFREQSNGSSSLLIVNSAGH